MPIPSFNQDKARRIIFVIFFIFWVYIWLLNFYRDFLHHAEETKQLCLRPIEKKWAYLLGADLYQLLSAAQKLIPASEKIEFIGSLGRVKGMLTGYILYPHLSSLQESKFIVVYKQPFAISDKSKVIYFQEPDIFITRK